MEKDVLEALGMKERSEAVSFLKQLWNGEAAACPKCGRLLEHLHQKAKKNNCDWICPGCREVYHTIRILDTLNEE
jgi:uncharacterized protein with PIN domain